MMKLLLSTLSKLPFSVLYLLSDIGYYLVYYVIRYRRDIVRSNLEHAFPEKNLNNTIKLEKQFYRFLCDNLIETLSAPSMSQEQLLARFTFTNLEVIQPYLDKKQSLQLLSIHQGCWEWLVSLLHIKLNAPVDAIYKPLHSTFFDEIFLSTRARFGAHLVPTEKATKAIIRNRREFRLFTMTADQAPIRREKKYWHEFFNRPAPFYLGTQKIAELTQFPVFYFSVHRTKRGHYKVTFELIAEPPFAKNSYNIINGYIEAMERAIRYQPETWLWSNRKWRRSPTGDENDIFAEGFNGEITGKTKQA